MMSPNFKLHRLLTVTTLFIILLIILISVLIFNKARTKPNKANSAALVAVRATNLKSAVELTTYVLLDSTEQLIYRVGDVVMIEAETHRICTVCDYSISVRLDSSR